jgi:lipid-binding SYLF domain-containing protein
VGAAPQSSNTGKFSHAVDRSRDAASILPLLTAVPEQSVPRELIDKSSAIGVFPKVARETIYFTHLIKGYGVISVRQNGDWTMPAFYQFSGSGYGKPFASKENYGVILLFIGEDTIESFEKGGVRLNKEKQTLAGPVEKITDAQRKELETARVIAYAYYNGKLTGVDYNSRFGLNPDNNINTPMYGVKGREILAGKEPDAARLPAGIGAFREALRKYYGKQ